MPQEFERRSFLAGAAALTVARSAKAQVAGADFSSLAKGLHGRLITPADPDYDGERRVFWRNLGTDRRPAAIAKCVHEDDIVRCLEFADTAKLEVAVRSGGHDALGASTCDGGLVIDLRSMAGCLPNPEGRTVTVGAGAKAGEVVAALEPMGQVVPFGDSGDVGVGGLCLGGGYGWLSGRDGATCDHMLRARMVLADGRRLTVDAESDPDLFWAIRGGGGNFGVATQFEFKTRPLGPVIAGKILFPAKDIGGFLRRYRDFAAVTPDPLQVDLSFGAIGILAQLCWSGAPEEADRALAPLLSYGPPIMVDVTPRAYSRVNSASNVDATVRAALAGGPPATNMLVLGGTLPGLTAPIIAVIETYTKEMPPGCGFALTHHLHGAVLRPNQKDSALIRLPGSICYHIDRAWAAQETEAQAAWAVGFQQALTPHAAPTYVNYMSSDAPAEVARAYGANFGRLRAIKRRYDPTNRFHRNRNIPPASAS